MTTSLSNQNESESQAGDTNVRWGLGDAIAGLSLTLVVPAIVGAAAIALAGLKPDDEIPLWGVALLQIPLWVGLLGAPLWASYRKGNSSLSKDFGLSMQLRDIPIGLGVGLSAQIGLGIMLQAIYRFFNVDTDQVGQTAKELTDQASGPVGVVLLILVVVVAAPILEELFYRGLWLKAIEARLGTAWAVVLSSVLFGAIHFQLYDFPALATIGLLAAILTVKFKRLGPAIWLHVAFNLTAVIALL